MRFESCWAHAEKSLAHSEGPTFEFNTFLPARPMSVARTTTRFLSAKSAANHLQCLQLGMTIRDNA